MMCQLKLPETSPMMENILLNSLTRRISLGPPPHPLALQFERFGHVLRCNYLLDFLQKIDFRLWITWRNGVAKLRIVPSMQACYISHFEKMQACYGS
jgi:hypothetical protein